MTAGAPPCRPSRNEVLWVLAAAAFARVLYFVFYRESPFFAAPILDSAQHQELARALAAGQWDAGAPYFRPPLYVWLLGAGQSLFGAGPWTGRLLNAAAGIATSLAVLWGGARLGLGRGWRVGAAVAASLYAPELFLEGELLGEPVATALAAWGLVFVIAAWSASPASAARTWFAGAVWWSLAALARAPLALLPPLAFLFAVAAPGPRGRRAALVALAAAAVWAGPAAIMAGHGAGFRFPATQGGINFYLGNHEGADGRGVDPAALGGPATWPDFAEASVRAASARAGRALSPAEASAFWTREGLAFWKRDPGAAVALTGRKGLYLIHGYETPNNRSLYAARRDVPWLTAILWEVPGLYGPTGLLMPLAAAGIWAARRRRRWLPVTATALTILLPLVLFFVSARFRVPALPALALLAALGAGALRRGGRGPWTVFVLVALAANLPWTGAVRDDPARDWLARGEAAFNAGRPDEARQSYEACLRIDPAEGRAHLGLAAVAEREGDLTRALAEVERAAALTPQLWTVEAAWAAILDRLGRPADAVDHLRRATALSPEQAGLWGTLGLTLEAAGRAEEAAAALEEAARRGDARPEVWNSLGRFRLLRGDRAGARGAWDRALELDANHYKALTNRGLLHAQQGDRGPALTDLEAAVAAAPDSQAARRARETLELVRSRLP